VYSVRLTVNGQSQTQPIAIKMDPRVKITPEVQRIFTLTARMEEGARNAASAYSAARGLADKLKARPQSAARDAVIQQVDEIAPPSEVAGAAGDGGGGAGRGGGGGGVGTAAPEPSVPPNLANIGAQMVAAALGMQASEMAPTAAQIQACSQQEAAYTALMAKWAALKAKVNGTGVPAGRGGGKP
jgi:hypothetical protein